RHQADGFVGGAGSHVRELLFLDDVDVQVALSRVLSDDHALVDFGYRSHEDLASLLQIEGRVAGDFTGAIRHQRAGGTARDFALPIDVAVEERVHDGGAARVRQDFAAQADEAA